MSSALAPNAENIRRTAELARRTAVTMNGLSALGLAGAHAPGAATGYARRATLAAQMSHQQEIMDQMMANMARMQPVIFRRLRLWRLASAKTCAWLKAS